MVKMVKVNKAPRKVSGSGARSKSMGSLGSATKLANRLKRGQSTTVWGRASQIGRAH